MKKIAQLKALAKTTPGIRFVCASVICESDGKGGAKQICFLDGTQLAPFKFAIAEGTPFAPLLEPTPEPPNLNGAAIKHSDDGKTIWVRIPRQFAKAIGGGCSCDYCKENPDKLPMWDTLCIPTSPEKTGMAFASTVHFPKFW